MGTSPSSSNYTSNMLRYILCGIIVCLVTAEEGKCPYEKEQSGEEFDEENWEDYDDLEDGDDDDDEDDYDVEDAEYDLDEDLDYDENIDNEFEDIHGEL